MDKYLFANYENQSYMMKKKITFLSIFLLMMLLISIIGLLFHGNRLDFLFYSSSTLFFTLALYFLKIGHARHVLSASVAILPLFIFADIMRFEFTSYEKVTETMMESFLAYLAVALFSTRRDHIIYTIVLNTCLTALHAFLINQFTYTDIPLPAEGYKYFIGGTFAVLLAGFLLWFNFRINEESLHTIMRSKDELELLIKERTESLEIANLELERSNRELYKISTLDPLTMIFNRRKIIEQAHEMIDQAKATQTSLFIVIIDIDNFKNINDTYGHVVGDSVIRTVVDHCIDLIRPTDCIGRLGGEEFLLVLKSDTLVEAMRMVDAMRTKVETSSLATTKGMSIHATISIGMSQLENEHTTLNDLILEADEALYRSKREGKNRITIAC